MNLESTNRLSLLSDLDMMLIITKKGNLTKNNEMLFYNFLYMYMSKSLNTNI